MMLSCVGILKTEKTRCMGL